MHKRIIQVFVCAAAACAVLAGCGRTDASDDANLTDVREESTAASVTPANTGEEKKEEAHEEPDIALDLLPKEETEAENAPFDDDYSEAMKAFDYKASDYVEMTPAETKPLLVDPGADLVSPEEVEHETMALFSDPAKATYDAEDEPAGDGKAIDVKIRYEAEDGTQVEKSQRIVIGRGDLPYEIERLFLGLKAGDKTEKTEIICGPEIGINALDGKTASVSGTLLSVRNFYSPSDETAAKITGGKLKSIDECRKWAREKIAADREDDRWRSLAGQMMEILKTQMTVKSLPEEALNRNLRKTAAALGGELGRGIMSEEDVRRAAEEETKSELALLSAAQEKGIELTEGDVLDAAGYVRDISGIETASEWDEYLAAHGKETVVRDALYIKVMNRLIEEAAVIPKS